MKKTFIPLILFVALFMVRCKNAVSTPSTSSNTGTTLTYDNYDAAHNVFRVTVSSANVPYSVSVKRFSPTNPTGDVQVQNQASGNPFEEQIVPAIGDSIKVLAQSDKGGVYLSIRYKGVALGPVVNQTNANGGTMSQFNYLVKN